MIGQFVKRGVLWGLLTYDVVFLKNAEGKSGKFILLRSKFYPNWSTGYGTRGEEAGL